MSVCSTSTCDLERECGCGAERLCRVCIHSRCRPGGGCSPGCHCRGDKLCRDGLHGPGPAGWRLGWLGSPGKGSVSSKSTDLADLNNEELSKELRARGLQIGPIVGSTRRLYEKKLAKLLEREDGATQRSSTFATRTVTVTNGGGGDEDEYSDSEPETAPARLSQPAAPSGGGDQLRQRRAFDSRYGYIYQSPRASTAAASVDASDLANLNPRSPSLRPVFLRDDEDQPTPRRGVRDVRGSYPREQYLLSKSATNAYAGSDALDGRYSREPRTKAISRNWLRLLVKLCVLLLLIGAGYYCYQNYGDASTIKSLQDAARDAVQKAAQKVEDLRNTAASGDGGTGKA